VSALILIVNSTSESTSVWLCALYICMKNDQDQKAFRKIACSCFWLDMRALSLTDMLIPEFPVCSFKAEARRNTPIYDVVKRKPLQICSIPDAPVSPCPALIFRCQKGQLQMCQTRSSKGKATIARIGPEKFIRMQKMQRN